ncbi:MAG TPA: hypothetical protein VK455_08220 [Thermoplasmata archaeon]|nr:hypothetical protein [Thermoplasmata archaeon]
MLRETTFVVGGALTIALGVALLVGLYLAGAGAQVLNAWIAGLAAVGFGTFFVHVGKDEARTRREYLRGLDSEAIRPPRPPPE